MQRRYFMRPIITVDVRCRMLLVLVLALTSGAGTGCRKPESPSKVTQAVTLADHTASVSLPYDASRYLAYASEMYRSVATRNRNLLDVLNPESELSELNRIGPLRGFPVAEETQRILYVAKDLCSRTDGTFDITVAPLAYLWGFEGGLVPSEPVPKAAIAAAMRGVGYRNLNVETRLVAYESPHTRVSLGNLVNSYSIDLTVIQLREKGVKNVLVDAGQVARAQGYIAEGEFWTQSVPHPFHLGEKLGSVRLDGGQGMSTVTKDDQYVVIGEERFHHIIDPRSGRPATGTAAVCVLAPSATEACALAKALFVVGVEDARSLLADFVRCNALIVPDREPMELWMTEGFRERVDMSPEMYDRFFLL